MKKMSKNVILFICGILVAFTIDVAAEAVISSEAVSYSNSQTAATTVDGALDELFSAVDINEKIGSTDISSIGDGTITGAIATQQAQIDSQSNTTNMKFLNPSNVIANTSSYGGTLHIANVDCWVYGYMKANSSLTPYMTLDGVKILQNGTNTTWFSFPMKRGQKLDGRASGSNNEFTYKYWVIGLE